MATVRIPLANVRVASTPDESVDFAGAAILEAARSGAQLVSFPECYIPGYRWPGSALPPPNEDFLSRAWAQVAEFARQAYRPTFFADPANTVHEKAMLCRPAENTCYFASVNCASDGSGTTSAIVRPDGTVQCYQPYGMEGLLIADIDLSLATGLLASRCRTY